MIKQNYFQCPSCKLPFGFQNTPKILKNCKHNLCINCLKTQKRCSLDNIETCVDKLGFKSFLTNIQLLQQIKEQNENKNKHNNIKNGDKLLVSGIKTEYFKRNQENKNIQMCLIHNKIADLICQQQKMFICSSCAHQDSHKNHNLISHSQLLKLFTNMTDDNYDIYEQIKLKQPIMNKKLINQTVQLQIQLKRNQILKQIKLFFAQLIQKIRKQQIKCIQQLDRIKIQLIQKLKQDINCTDLQKEKNCWVKELYKLTNLTDGLYRKIDINSIILYRNQNSQLANKTGDQSVNINTSLYKKGQKILNDLNNYELSIKNQVETFSFHLNCTFDDNIWSKIDNMYSFQLNLFEKDKKEEKKYNHRQMVNSREFKIQKFVQRSIIQPQITLNINSTSQVQSILQGNSIVQKNNLQLANLGQKIGDIKQTKQIIKISQKQNTQQIDAQNLQQDQDFLLDTTNSIKQSSPHRIQQISFQQQYSLIKHNQFNSTQFTPVLMKEDYSIVQQQQSEQKTTVLNCNISFNNNTQIQDSCQKTVIKMSNKNISHQNKSHQQDAITEIIKIKQKQQRNNSSKKQNSSHKSYYSPIKHKHNNLASQNNVNILKDNNSKKKKKLQIPQKYMKTWQDAKQDNNQLIDLTGAQLGDSHILQLCKIIKDSNKIKSLKLIRNKLSDEIVLDLIGFIRGTNISSLNLSQNNLTEKSIEILQLLELGNLKSITLSLNKINFRKAKDKIQNFKSKGVTLSI